MIQSELQAGRWGQPRWRNGRRGGLKIRFPQGSGGSNPFLGTSLPPVILDIIAVGWYNWPAWW